jgi:ubiquinone/menaquinone biosynthesis C-methylase UbiE
MENNMDSDLRDNFYDRVLVNLMRKDLLSTDMKVLVACGGVHDRNVLYGLGFRNVTISNIDQRESDDEYKPFPCVHQNVEHLSFADDEFDFSIVHNGLHHCRSPHRGLLEMYRVSRKGLLVMEPRDTILVRLGVLLKLGQDYEISGIATNNLEVGGCNNTQIPNFIYRWTEREVEKTIATFAPWCKHRYLYMYSLRVPWGRLKTLKNKLLLVAVTGALPLLKVFFALFPKQANGFAFVVEKPQIPQALHPWLQYVGGEVALNPGWVRSRYDVAS